MIEFDVKVQGQKVSCTKLKGELVSGLRGVKVHFTWGAEWQRLRRIAVFRAGSISRNVMDLENECEIPWEVLREPGYELMIGIQGTNEEGTAVTPTLEAEMGEILRGAEPSKDPTADPSLPAWKWLQNLVEKTVEKISQLLQSGKEEFDQVAEDGRAEIDAIAKQMQDMIDNGQLIVQPGEDGQVRIALQNHLNDKNNPHGVKPAQIGAMATTGGKFTGMVMLNGVRLTKERDYGIEVPNFMEEGRVFLVEDLVNDEIVEYGRANKWNYLKLADGTAACWKTVTDTVYKSDWVRNTDVPVTLYWTSNRKIEFAYPFSFVERPSEFMTIANCSSWDVIDYVSVINPKADKTNSYRMTAYKQPSMDLELTLSMLVVGRWK